MRYRLAVSAMATAALVAPLQPVAQPAAAMPAAAAAQPVVAPYLDMSGSPARLYAAIRTEHLRWFSAGFVLGHGCTPIWDTGTNRPVSRSRSINAVISTAKSRGAQVVVSFGGQQGRELATTCHRHGRLVAAYTAVVRRFAAREVDFDIEGTTNDVRGINLRRFRAIRSLEQRRPGLRVSVTIATLGNGLDADGRAILREAKQAGARVDLVNLMAMDYYDGTTAMGPAAISAARHALPQLRQVWPRASYRNLGITPMIGRNDDRSEVFTRHDAVSVRAWAGRHHLGRLSFWSLARDRRLAYTAAFLGRG